MKWRLVIQIRTTLKALACFSVIIRLKRSKPTSQNGRAKSNDRPAWKGYDPLLGCTTHYQQLAVNTTEFYGNDIASIGRWIKRECL